MDATETVHMDDLWTPEKPLPARATLGAIADRLGEAWGIRGLGRRVKIGYNPRLRTALGRALLDEHRIELNVRLLREHPDELIATVAHELAHVVVHLRYAAEASRAHGRIAPHGQQFRMLMRAAGISPSATHDLPSGRLRRPRRRYLYLHCCSDCGYSFIARKVRRNCYCLACGPQMQWNVIRPADTKQGLAAMTKLRDERNGANGRDDGTSRSR